jgi:hypothetical protein
MSFERVSRRVDSLLLSNFPVFRLLVEITAVHLWKGCTCVGVTEKTFKMLLLEIVNFDVIFRFTLRVYLTILSMCLVTMAPSVLRTRTVDCLYERASVCPNLHE